MNLVRFVTPFLVGMALMPISVAGQTNVARHAATVIYNCLNTGNCNAPRGQFVGQDMKPYYKMGASFGEFTFGYTVPVGERRLEVHLQENHHELTMIDVDVDGVVDYVIESLKTDNAVWIYGKQQKIQHARVQVLFNEVLSEAVRELGTPLPPK